MKRKWLKVLMMLMMAGASFGGPMNPREIEDLMHIMNETRIEFTIPDESHKGEGGKPGPYGLTPG
jgi:hypothetical protein